MAMASIYMKPDAPTDSGHLARKTCTLEAYSGSLKRLAVGNES